MDILRIFRPVFEVRHTWAQSYQVFYPYAPASTLLRQFWSDSMSLTVEIRELHSRATYKGVHIDMLGTTLTLNETMKYKFKNGAIL